MSRAQSWLDVGDRRSLAAGVTMAEAAEGSQERRWARRALYGDAKECELNGMSFRDWIDTAEQSLLDAVSQRDIDAIEALVWSAGRRWR